MLVFLASIFFFLLLLIFYLCHQIIQQRKNYTVSLQKYYTFLDDLKQQERLQTNQIHLSDALKQQLDKVMESLSKEIYEVGYEVFQQSFPKKNS